MGRLTNWLMPPTAPAALTAAATIISAQPGTDPQAYRSRLIPAEQEWQREVWGFYDSLGIFRNAVNWKADMLSRVRLKAAKRVPGSDEPQIMKTGPAVDIVGELSVGAQSTIMSNLATYLSIPGEGYLIGETDKDGVNRWQSRSTDEVRYRPGTARGDDTTESPYEVVDERSGGSTIRWRRLNPNSLVVRVWRPHKRYFHIADSSARAARNTMRELELVNRRFQAEYMSRLASAGVFAIPSEVTFPVRPEFADAPDPFIAEFIEMAAEAIKTPGSAASLVPIPMKMPGEYIGKLQHLDFSVKLDEKLIEKREDARNQLAIDLDVPPEALMGHSDVNHWTGWLIEETGFKVYLAPDCELICAALTQGYLVPRLKAAGEPVEDIVIWYDASEVTLRPDRSASATEAYDKGEINATAYRREIGMDESDLPSDDELTKIILLRIALAGGTDSLAALKELTGVDIAPAPVAVPTEAPAASGAGEAKAPVNGPPVMEPPLSDKPPKSQPKVGDGKPPKAAAAQTQLLHQATLLHAMRIGVTGRSLLHPRDCAQHLMSCPVTHATWGPELRHLPGGTGVYQCWLSPTGEPMIGSRLLDADVKDMTPTLSIAVAR